MQRDADLYTAKYSEATESIQDSMSDEKTASIIKELHQEYDLADQKQGDLAYIIGTVLLGMTHPKDFIKTLESGLEITHESAVAIAKRVNSDIFAPVKKELIAVHNIGGTKKTKPQEDNAPEQEEASVKKGPEEPEGEGKPEGEEKPEDVHEIHNKPLPKPPAPPAPPAPKKPGDDPYREPIN